MEPEAQCPICLLGYTSAGSHRMASLKCGHCFGHKCIEKWVSMHKKPHCPTCSSPCRMSHLRVIYVARGAVPDQARADELVEKYLQEAERRQRLEAEVAGLRAQIDILRLSARPVSAESSAGFRLHPDRPRFTKIHFVPSGSLVDFDPISRLAVITCLKDGVHGLCKYGLGDSRHGGFVRFREKISGLQVSTFRDGLCLVASGCEVLLVNLCNDRVVFRSVLAHRLTAVGFDRSRRNILYAGDVRGNVHAVDTLTGEATATRVSEHAVHSVCMSRGVLYAATVFGVFRLDTGPGTPCRPCALPLEFDGVCVNLSGSEDQALLTFRNRDLVISQVLLGETETQFFPALRQRSRHNDRVFGGHVYVVDDIQNTVNVLAPGSLRTVHSYRFKEGVVNFAVGTDALVVLTQRGVYWFGSDARGCG